MAMKLLFPLFFLISSQAMAFDCSSAKPFVAKGSQKVAVTVSKISWKNGANTDEQICESSTNVRWFDVRGREEEAYYCLKPTPQEVITCKTKLNGDEAEIEVVPASWIRTWKPSAVREYRFHAYVVKVKTPDYLYDVFSRSLQDSLESKNLIIEGSLKTGSANPTDGFWVRADFQK